MRSGKTWKDKLADTKGLPKVQKIPDKMAARYGNGTLVIPSPKEVDEIMRTVPKGKVITIPEILSRLARRHNATIGCPLTTGIFVWIAAHAAEEEVVEGKKRITPYWRTLKSRGELNEKYPGGMEAQRAKLESEGHTVLMKGKKLVVEGWQKSLVME